MVIAQIITSSVSIRILLPIRTNPSLKNLVSILKKCFGEAGALLLLASKKFSSRY